MNAQHEQTAETHGWSTTASVVFTHDIDRIFKEIARESLGAERLDLLLQDHRT